jgi:hypothetical protein
MRRHVITGQYRRVVKRYENKARNCPGSVMILLRQPELRSLLEDCV